LQERSDFLEAFYKESDRGAVLIAVALIHHNKRADCQRISRARPGVV
jgi:hypothetical protein